MAKVNIEKFSKEDLQKIVAESNDKTELATKLGFTYFNGKVSKKIIDLINKFGISVDHFDPSKKLKDRRKYQIIKKNCPVCFKEFETLTGVEKEKITCSCRCSNIFFSASKHSYDANKKRSKSLIKYNGGDLSIPRIIINNRSFIELNKKCPICNIEFKTIKKRQSCCSNSCAAKLRASNSETNKKISIAIKQRIADGTHKGWASRYKLEPSFPEKITIEILLELGIDLIREYKCNKWFIDFADLDRKIAIEIDGKQHELPERKTSDEEKDNYLISQGWKVHRIKWRRLTPEIREELKISLQKILI